MQNNKNSLTKMAGILVFGRIIAFSITFCIPIFLVRIFNQEEFGIYKQVFLISMTVIPILGFSIGQNVFYFFPSKPYKRKEIVFNILFIYLIVGILSLAVFVFYPSVISSIFKEERITEFVPWIGVYAVFYLLSSFFENVIIANREVTLSSIVIILSDLIRAVFLLTAAFLSKSLFIVVLSAIAYSIIRLILFLIYILKRIDGNFLQFDFKLIKEQLVYSFPYGLESVLFYLRTQLHNFFVAFFFDSKMFAVYSIGVFSLSLLNFIRQSVGTILIFEISRLQSSNEINRIKTIFSNSVKKLALCFLPMYFFLLVIRKEFIVFLFTDTYVSSVPLFSINLFTLVFSILIVDPIFKAFPRYQYYRLNLSFITFLLLPLTLYFFNQAFGIIGIVSGNILLIGVLQILLFIKCLKILYYSRKDIYFMLNQNLKTLIVSVISCIPLIVVKPLLHFNNFLMTIIIESLLYGTVYVYLIHKFDLLTLDERQKIYKFLITKIQYLNITKLVKNSTNRQ